ncbi:MAG: DNA repair protein RecN [Bradymonadales bacterium]|nr:DNA repair protein RecN [Bradymonadales bacterium]
MLVDLRIENLVLVEQASVIFTAGLNVVSGETGAGKTLLVQALSLLTGTRASTELVRTGCEVAVVEGRFELNGEESTKFNRRLVTLGLPSVGDELVIRRRITREGKSRVYINDASATAAGLQELTFDLVELTGQLEQYGLLRPERHLELLDAYAVNQALLQQVESAVLRMRQGQQQHRQLESALAHRAERDEFLRFYLAEFEALAPQPDEDVQLLEQAERLRNADRLRQGIGEAIDWLYESEESAYDLVSRARGALESLAAADSHLAQPVAALRDLGESIDQIHRTLVRNIDEVVASPEELEALETRLHQIQRMCRKHGATLGELIEKMEAARLELTQLCDLEQRLEEGRRELSAARSEAIRLAESLTAARRAAIEPLVEATEHHLRDLGFQHCRFEVALETDPDPDALTERGADRVCFLLSANPGEPLRPLARVASGGELSRMLLALKCALAQVDTVGVHVFDEIDTGLGGGSAEIVGRKIRELADHTQVLCVTHLPQIASFADTHLTVVKETSPSGARTVLRMLSGQEREAEVARMLGGLEITETTLLHAREMLSRSSLPSHDEPVQ